MVDTNKLKGEIVANGFTQDQLAEALNMQRSTLSSKLNGHKQFKLDEAKKICKILSIVDAERIKSIFFA